MRPTGERGVTCVAQMTASDVGVDLSDPAIESIAELGASKGHTLVGLPVEAADLFVHLEQDRYCGENALGREGGWSKQSHYFWSKRSINARQWKIMDHMFVHDPFEKLQHLALDGSATARGSKGEHLGIDLLCRAYAAEVFPRMVYLNLGSNQIECSDAQVLIHALRASKCGYDKLEILYLNNNRVGDASIDLLADGTLAKIEVLHLESNMITDVGATVVAKGTWPKLDRLYIQNNLFEDEAAQTLASAVADADGPLRKLLHFTLDSFDFSALYDFRNKDTIVRVGGAPPKIDYAGKTDQGRQRDKMSNRDMILFCTMRARTPDSAFARILAHEAWFEPTAPRVAFCAVSTRFSPAPLLLRCSRQSKLTWCSTNWTS